MKGMSTGHLIYIDFIPFQHTLLKMAVVAEMIREARLMRRVSLNQAALETRIRQSILESLEEGDYAALPPRPFLRGLLRNYAVYLNLDPDDVLDEYDLETGARASRRVKQPPPEPQAPIAPPIAYNPPPTPQGNTYAPPLQSGIYNAPAPLHDTQEQDAFPFPPFEIASNANTARPTETPVTQDEPEAVTDYHMTQEVQVPPPTMPLNLSQEPPTFAQRVGSTRIPELVAIITIAIALFMLVSQGFSQVQQFINPLANQPTPRPSMTASPTIPAGSTPTGIPTLLQTGVAPTSAAVIVPTLAVNQTGTAVATSEVISPTATATLDIPADASMTLEIEATGTMTAWIIVDEESVFNGTLTNEKRTYVAHARLFMEIKNIENGRVFFQGTRILPRDQQERSDLFRAWLINPLGTPVIIPPTPYPSPVAPTEPPSRTPSPSSTATRTATASATDTQTPTATATSTPTRTLTATASATVSRTATVTATVTRTSTRTNTPTIGTRTPTRTNTPTATRTATPTASPTPTP